MEPRRDVAQNRTREAVVNAGLRSSLALLLCACACSHEGRPSPGPPPAPATAPAPAPAPAPASAPAAVPPPAGAIWRWAPSLDLYPFVPVEVAADGARFVLWRDVTGADRAGPARLRRERADGTVVWSITLPPAVGVAPSGDAHLAGGALAVGGGRVYVAQYHRIATGCALSALATDDGHALWAVSLEGAGPIGHSKYSNRVQLAAEGGDPVARGWESAARYVERRDGATGRLRTHDKLGAAPFVPDVNVAIYAEVARMLRRQPSYEVSVAGFVTRHVLDARFPSDEARTALARDAAARLGGLPVYGTGYRMQLTVAGDGRKVTLRARRR